MLPSSALEKPQPLAEAEAAAEPLPAAATTAAVRAASRICPRARRVRTAAASGCLNAAATAETTPSTATEKTSHTPTGTAGAVVAAESAAVEGYPAQAVRFRRR